MDLVHQAAGGKRNVAVADVDSVRMVDEMKKFQHVGALILP